MTQAAGQSDDLWGRRRTRLVAGVLAAAFAVIVGRAAQVAFAGTDAVASGAGVAGEVARRADIVDRNGDLLATSLATWSLAADPSAIWDGAEVAQALGEVLPGLNVDDLARRLSDRERRFVWVQRGLTPRQRQQVFALGLEGLLFEEEMRRVYPGGQLAGHLLGFTDIDGKGVEGMELAIEPRLAAGGKAVRLTIDAGAQFALESELDIAAEQFEMKGAAGLIIDASTGAVRAAASWPAVDPNHPGALSDGARQNRYLGAVYELGSIYKPLTVAAALDAGAITAGQSFDVSAPVKIGSVTVRDTHSPPNPQHATPADILAFSSNIGVVQIAQLLGAERQREFLERAGLLSRPVFEGPSAAAPLSPVQWDAVTAATVSYGHGVAVTPLAFAMSFASFAAGGDLLAPVFLEPEEGARGEIMRQALMAPETAASVVAMMRHTVTEGTGVNAEAPGYEVAGKTGTAEKAIAGGYDRDRNITSFAAVFPASRPQFVVLIVLDDAQPKSGAARTAAYTAAAVTGSVIARAAPMLGVQPVMTAAAGPATPPHDAPPPERTP